ncbi:spore germination protein GerPE [Bacillus sp. T33-2]|uniref:spore germination protein GerPE n=1 Tax=Bacillus sp. T33-2 TaxID=2054168 RepID=UPI000C782D00|nr:spore germination protein GerPE [Bacillus sp. T33-2]PLR97672.1 spore germination protein GerPE [Bacillus sp. T33-2]
MLSRTSVVDEIKISTLSFSSIFQIGDAEITNGFSRAIAVQREAETFFGNEGNFAAFPIFSEPIPIPPIEEELSFIKEHINPVIKVNNIIVTGVSSSSVVQLGSTRSISMEARVKHIRQLLPREEDEL